MAWTVRDHPAFEEERKELDADISDKLDEIGTAIELWGPNLGRPLVDTLKGSKYKNMKEIRFGLRGAWRFAFAFDPKREAVILVGGNKEGVSSPRFYNSLVATADTRFDEWLQALESEE